MEEGMLGLVRRGMVVWGNGEGVSNKNTNMFPLHAAGHVRQVKLQIRRSLFIILLLRSPPKCMRSHLLIFNLLPLSLCE